MNEQMTAENQVPATLVLQIEAMIAVGGLSPAQAGTFRQAADRIEELVAERDQLKRKYEALVEELNRLVARWSEGDFDLPSHYVRGKTDGCHQCANELSAMLQSADSKGGNQTEDDNE